MSTMTKLTLSVPKDVSRKAKELAKERGTSVSAMVSDFVRSQANASYRRIPPGPLALKVSGIAKLPEGKTYRELLEEALMEKYGFTD